MTFREKLAQQLEWRVRYPSRVRRDRHAPDLAARAYRVADRLAYAPFADELFELPAPRELNGVTLDVLGDLAAYTGMSLAQVEELVRRREKLSFRAEWYATPEELRQDRWFYLSSKTYLFGNAAHVLADAWIERFVRSKAPGGAVWEFGGGTGNLAIHLAALGHEVALTELNALQRDFVRFRAHTHLPQGRLTTWAPWDTLPREHYDVVVALDVFEHVPDLRAVLDDQILPALAPGGFLVENSPFAVNVANPMHHTDFGFDAHLAAVGLSVVDEGEDKTRVWARM